MITHKNLNFPILKQITTDERRIYVTPEGNSYPSVTTVLGKTSDNSWIESWKAAVGQKELELTSKRATNRGTAVHKLCEDYLNNLEPKPSIFDLESYNQLKQVLVRVDNVYAIERMVYSNKLKTAGTVDCIAEFDGKLSIIDWKTSGYIKYRNDITSYFMQCSFYAVAMYEMFNINIHNIVIAMAVDGNKNPLIFEEPVKLWLPEYINRRKHFKSLEGY